MQRCIIYRVKNDKTEKNLKHFISSSLKTEGFLICMFLLCLFVTSSLKDILVLVFYFNRQLIAYLESHWLGDFLLQTLWLIKASALLKNWVLWSHFPRVTFAAVSIRHAVLGGKEASSSKSLEWAEQILLKVYV